MIRDYEVADESVLKAIHDKSGFDYRFPDLDDPIFLVRKVCEEDGIVTQAIVLELTASVYLWVDPTAGTPDHRLRQLAKLVKAVKQEAWKQGLGSLYAVIPPEIEAEFSSVLEHIGMSRDRAWPKWSIDLHVDHS
jgi:hypothetical protein